MSAVNLLGLAGSVIVLVSLFEMLRRHRLREKYAVIWFIIAICAFIVALFPSCSSARPLSWASRFRPTCCSSPPPWCC